MAKKKDFTLDDYAFDSGLDTGDMDFSFDAPELKDDRKPVTKIKDGLISGATETATSPAFIRDMVKKSLPRGYGSALDLADQAGGTLKSLYNDAAKEIKPVLKDLKRVTGRLMPMAEPVLPKSMAEKIKAWTASDAKGSPDLSAEQQRDAAIQATMAEIFQMQEKQRQEDNAEDSAKENIKDGVEQKRHLDMLGQLDSMRVSLQQLANYQDRIGSSFQRKSLELQYRHYFVAVDLLEETKKQAEVVKGHLGVIEKNTALPEFVKINKSEVLQQVMRNKFADSLSDGLIGGRRQFLKTLGEKLSGAVKEKARGFADSVQMGLSGLDQMADMREMQESMAEAGMGDGLDTKEMGGQIVGGMATNALGAKLGKWLRGKSEKHEGIAKWGNKLQYVSENTPQLLTDWAKSDKGEAGILGGIVRVIKDSVNSANSVDNSFEVDKAGSMQSPDTFRRQTNKSITEVIPGFLARIHQEIRMLRTGEENVPMLVYDYDSGTFVDKAALSKKLFKGFFNEYDKQATNEQTEAILNMLDPEKTKLTDEQRKALGKKLMADNLRNDSADQSRLTSEETWYGGDTSKHASEIAELFKEYFKDDKTNSRQLEFSRAYNKLGSSLSDPRKVMQDQINLGNRDLLMEMGLLTDTNTLNTAKQQAYYMGESFDPTQNQIQKKTPYKLNAKRGGGKVEKERPTFNRPTSTSQATGYVGETPQPQAAPTYTETKIEDVKELIGAIKESSSKTASETINETLIRIETLLQSGNFGGGHGGSGEGGKKRWFDKSLGETMGDLSTGAINLGRTGLNKAKAFGKSVEDRLMGIGKSAWGGMKTSFSWLKDKKDEAIDIYVKGEMYPRMTAAKLRAGEYIDDATGKIVTSLKDIKGNIRDKAGNIVLEASEAKDAFLKNNFVQKALSSVNSAWGLLKGLPGRLDNQLPRLYNFAKDLVKRAYNLLSTPQDVYVKGKENPVLLAVTMKAGGYKSRISGKIIQTLQDIDGPVLDDQGNLVLTAEELAAGIYDKTGKPIKVGINRVVDKVKGVGKFAFDKASKLFKGAKDKASEMFDSLKNWWNTSSASGSQFNILSGNNMGMNFGGKSTNATNRLLLNIRDVLNYRLPGDPMTFDDSDLELGPGGPGLMSKIKDKFSRLKNKLKDKFEDLKWRHAGIGDKLTDAKDKMAEKLSGLKDKYSDAKDSIKDKARALKDRLTGAKDSAKGHASSLLTKAKAKADKVKEKAVAGMAAMPDLLKDIRDRLAPKKKHVVGDAGDDGTRDGSYEDLMRRKGFLQGSKPKDGEGQDKSGIDGGKAGLLAGLMSKFGRKKKDEEDDEGGMDLSDAKAGWDMAKDGWAGAKKMGGKLLKGGKGLLGKGAGLIGKVGMKGLGLAGAAYGAYSAYDNFKQGNYGSAALDAGLAAGGVAMTGAGTGLLAGAGSALAGAGTAAAGGLAALGGLISAPVILSGLALAAVGTGAYLGYKYLTRKKLNALNKYRYAQYGFSSEDTDHVGTVLGLEDTLAPAVTYSKGIAKLDDKKVDLKKIIESFDVSLEDQANVKNWMTWFTNRFKPVYLTHMTALHTIDPKLTLNDLDKLPPADKKKYLDVTKWPDGPYSVFVSPFPKLEKLSAGAPEITAAVTEAEAAIKEEEQKSGEGEKKTGSDLAAGAVAATATAGAVGTTPESATGNNQAKTSDLAGPAAAAATAAVPAVTTGITEDGAKITIEGKEIVGEDVPLGRLDALRCVRFKTYGLKELTMDQVKNIYSLEYEVGKGIKFKKGNTATWEGSPDLMLKTMGIQFGTHGVNNSTTYNWISWFTQRFMPVYLTYRTALATFTNKQDEESALTVLKPQQALDIALQVFATKSNANGGMSVWKVGTSPWPAYEINMDEKSVDGNLAGMREKVGDQKLEEAFGRIESGNNKEAGSAEAAQAKAKADGVNEEAKPDDKPTSLWGNIKQKVSDVVSGIGNAVSNAGTSVKNAAIDAYDAAKGTVNSMLGREVQHPGGGTGGDINNLPKAEGSGWAKMKDLIYAVGKMTGVDPKLLASMAAIESGFNPSIKAGTSSATGLFQFINDTWRTMVRKYGPKYGMDTSVAATDPRANALMGAEYIKENLDYLSKSVKRPLTDTDAYIAHFLGAGGAKKFLTADPNAVAAEVFPKESRANAPIFYTKDGKPRTIAEIYNLFTERLRSRAKQLGVDSGGDPTPVAGGDQKPSSSPGSEAITSGKKGSDTGSVPSAPASSGATPAPAGDAAKALPSSAPAIPVSNQTPAAGTTASAPAPAASKSSTPAPTSSSSVDPGKLAVDPGFGPNSVRSLSEQTKARQTDAAAGLDAITGVMNKSIGIQEDQLEVLKRIYQLMQGKSGDSGSSKVEPAPVAEGTKPSSNLSKQPKQMTTPPVSFDKRNDW